MSETTTPFVGLGTTFQFGITVSPAAPSVTLNGVSSVAFSGDKVSTDKTTNMQSVNGVDTYIPGTTEPGSIDVKCQYLPADSTHVSLVAVKNTNLTVQFLVSYPGGSQRAFAGIVESYTPSIPLDKVATVDIKIKITGPITEELS